MEVFQKGLQNGTQTTKLVDVKYFPNLIGNIYFKDIPITNERRVFALIPYKQNSVIRIFFVEGILNISNSQIVGETITKDFAPLLNGKTISKMEELLLGEFARKEKVRIDEYPSENSKLDWQENSFEKIDNYYSEFKFFFRALNKLLPSIPYFGELRKALVHFEKNDTAREEQFKEDNNAKKK